MTTEIAHTLNGNALYAKLDYSNMPSGLYRFLIPAGTWQWHVSVQTYNAPSPAKALLSFDAPPVGPGEPAGSDTRNTLSLLWDGATLAFESPPNSCGLTISQPESTSSFLADRDRWLYLQLEFPGGHVYSWQSHIVLHPSVVQPPARLEQRALQYAQASGLVDALRKASSTTTDDELVAWVLSVDNLWPSICRLVEIAEEQKPNV